MGDAARQRVDALSTVRLRIGRYVGNDGQLALVDLGDQRVAVQFATPWVPQINEPVWVDSVDGVLRLTGPTTPKPGSGVVATITGNQATVVTDFGEFALTVAPTDPMPSSGDTVGIVWSGPTNAWCTLLVDLPDAGTPPPAPGGGGGAVRTAEFRAIDAGSTNRGSVSWWQAQPWSSENTYGAWFYGTQIKDTIPAGAVFESLEFYVAWDRRRYGGSRFTLHSDPFKAGIPAMSSYTVWNPEGGWQTPPDPVGWFNALKAGGARFGVGLNQGGWEQFKSLAQDGMSGALRIRWR